jgi:outer membrane protein assembly factor BamB
MPASRYSGGRLMRQRVRSRRFLHAFHRSISVCIIVLAAAAAARLSADDWPEWRGRGRIGVWTETGIVEKLPETGLPVVWRTPIHAGYAGPAVAGGRVFITDSRRIESKRANQVIERALAIDERTGGILWTKEWQTNYSGLQLVYAIGPRATPTVDGDRVYVLGAMGNLLALDVETGRVLWEKDYVRDFDASVPTWGIAGAPLVDGNLLICLVGGEPDAKLVALDKVTGKEIWRALSSDSEPGYNQPIIIEAGGARQLILFHPKGISSLDPVTGKVYWFFEHTVQMGIVVATPVHSGPYLFVTSQYGGARMFRLASDRPAATLLWGGPGEQDPGFSHDTPDTMNSVISTPVIHGEYVYGLDNDGQFRCLAAATGKQLWKTDALLKEHAMYGTAFFVRHGDRYFINNDRGELVLARLSPEGFQEISRVKLIEPTNPYVRRRQLQNVLWSHAAYANRHIVVRNDNEIIRASLAAGS